MSQDKPDHPGRTPAQRLALDAIGCGNPSPIMAPATRRALLDGGLIAEVGQQIVGRDRFGDVTVPAYDMPIPVHWQWCAAIAAIDEEMDANCGGCSA